MPLELRGNSTRSVAAGVRIVKETAGPAGRIAKLELEVTITNRKATAVQLEWATSPFPSARVTAESSKHTMPNGELWWRIALKPQCQTKLHYTLAWG